MPEYFGFSGRGEHREGLVVEFTPDDKAGWVGNFQRALTSFDAVFAIPDTKECLVISGGKGYVVDVSTRQCRGTFGGQVRDAWSPTPDVVVFSNGIAMEAFGPTGPLWRSRRISWDGFQSLRLERGRILGEAWSPIDARWSPFAIDLKTGEVEGGSYPSGESK